MLKYRYHFGEIYQEVPNMTGTEHYLEIVDLARQNLTDSRNPIFKPLMDIDELLYRALALD